MPAKGKKRELVQPAKAAAKSAKKKQETAKSESKSDNDGSDADTVIDMTREITLSYYYSIPRNESRRISMIASATLLTSRTYFQPVDYAKKYREAHHDEILHKQREKYANDATAVLRYKILYSLNRNLSTRPHSDTIAKYGLYQDNHTGKWKYRHGSRPAEENE